MAGYSSFGNRFGKVTKTKIQGRCRRCKAHFSSGNANRTHCYKCMKKEVDKYGKPI